MANETKANEVVAEKEFKNHPNALEISQFLINHPSANFCSVEHNYKVSEVMLPFS